MPCSLMPTNYFVVVVFPSRQIKSVVRLTACNYERCVSVTIFSGLKIRLRRLQTIYKINKKKLAGAITYIQPSKYVLEVNLHAIMSTKLRVCCQFNDYYLDKLSTILSTINGYNYICIPLWAIQVLRNARGVGRVV